MHLATQAAKSLAAEFYGRPVERSYFLGCSGGGRQALKEMQLYPLDYDGVVAGAPGPYMPLQSVRMMWFSLLQQREPAAALGEGDWDLYETSAVKHCDPLDGVRDGIVENPMQCRFDTSALECRPGQTNACLSPAKRAMLDRIAAPMLDEEGRPMDRGLQPGVRTRPGPPSPLLRAMWADGVYDDPDWDPSTFRRTADLEAANRMMPELRADRVNVAPFVSAGGKAILYQGWADPSTNADPTIDYYTGIDAELIDSVRELRRITQADGDGFLLLAEPRAWNRLAAQEPELVAQFESLGTYRRWFSRQTIMLQRVEEPAMNETGGE